MRERITCRIDRNIKEDYYTYIQKTHGLKHRKTGINMENALKLYLTLQGGVSYADDPDVQELLESAKDISCTHTQSKNESKKDSKATNGTSKVEKLEHEIEEMKNTLDEMKALLVQATQKEPKTEPKKERDSYRQMDQFVSRFQEEYGEDHQVSLKDISKLVMKTHRVTDKRSITNRINYLVANEYIEPYAPNVYNIKPIISP